MGKGHKWAKAIFNNIFLLMSILQSEEHLATYIVMWSCICFGSQSKSFIHADIPI